MFDESSDYGGGPEDEWQLILANWSRELKIVGEFLRKNPQYQTDLEGETQPPFTGLKLVGLEANVHKLRQRIRTALVSYIVRYPAHTNRIAKLPVP